MLVKLLTFGLTSIKDRALGGKGGLNTLSNYLSRTLFGTSWECIHTYMHTYVCIYIHTYIHTNAYMHTHKQSGVLSQSRHTSRNGRHYIKVCGPKKAKGSAIWNDFYILFLPLDTC